MNDRDKTRAAALMERTALLNSVERVDTPVPGHGLILVDRYELGAVLGRGATGVVHRGRDRVLRRDVAIKLLYPDLAHEKETSARFQQEAQLAARIHHPNAVAIFDTGVHDGQPFIVMECLPGETLSGRIATHPLPFDQVREIGVQILGALDAAHQQGVIHRDIKPSNLLLTTTGSVKVADFGIATEADRHSLTSVGFVVGTLAYLAPERLRGVPATAQSDIYATGVVLYEALTGRKPFAGDTAASLLDQISNGAPVDITSVRPDIDPALARVVMRALEREPAARFATAAAMAQALSEARTTVVAVPAPPAPPVGATVALPIAVPLAKIERHDRRGRSILAAVLAAMVVALAMGAFAARGGGLPSTPPTSTAPVGADPPSNSKVIAPVVSTTVVTSVRPSTTRATTTTAPQRTTRPKKNSEDEDD